MIESGDPGKPPLPKCCPRLAKRALVFVHSMLKAAFDIEVVRRLDSMPYHTHEHAEHQRLRPHQSTLITSSNGVVSAAGIVTVNVEPSCR